ncbi:MAG: hypothetical protein AAGG99_06415 [Pseudomonadota bacterium]
MSLRHATSFVWPDNSGPTRTDLTALSTNEILIAVGFVCAAIWMAIGLTVFGGTMLGIG